MVGGSFDAAVIGESGGRLDFEAWSTAIRSICGSFNFESEDPKNFAGWASVRRIGGFDALRAHSANVVDVRRNAADIRRDDKDHFFLIAQLSGRSVRAQRSDSVILAPGDMTLIDSTKPSTFHYFDEPSTILSLHLPRKQLVAYLGFVPNGASSAKSDGISSHVLFNMISQAAFCGPSAAGHSVYFDCAILDLIGASFDRGREFSISESTQSNLLFSRICETIRQKFLDPDFSAADVARSTGISMRYLQKLFAARETSCTRFILSCRLDHAAQLLRRRRIVNSKLGISEIAHLSGFRDAAYFSRAFSDRFGCTPGAH